MLLCPRPIGVPYLRARPVQATCVGFAVGAAPNEETTGYGYHRHSAIRGLYGGRIRLVPATRNGWPSQVAAGIKAADNPAGLLLKVVDGEKEAA